MSAKHLRILARTWARLWTCLGLAGLLIAVPVINASAQSIVRSERLVVLDGPHNLRDLGGYPAGDGRMVRWGKLYRSDNLAGLSRADKAQLIERNITTVIDFRSEGERTMAATSWSGTAAPEIRLLPIGGTAADWSVSLARLLRTGDFSGRRFSHHVHRRLPHHSGRMPHRNTGPSSMPF